MYASPGTYCSGDWACKGECSRCLATWIVQRPECRGNRPEGRWDRWLPARLEGLVGHAEESGFFFFK